MTQDTIDTLAEMGFKLGTSYSAPSSEKLELQLTVVRSGTGSIVFCNGGMAEYDLLANHGAINRTREIKTVCGGDVPYITLSMSKLERVFRSIAMMRMLCSGDRSKSRNHQSIANRLAKQWIAELPSDDNDLYSREIAAQTIADSYREVFGATSEETAQDELPSTPLFEAVA